MSDSIIVQPVVNQVTVTEEVNEVIVSSVGVQGATGATGAKGDKGDTGAKGAQGSSGVVSVTAPITNTGTSTSAVIGIDQTGLTVTESQVTNLVTDLAAKVPTSRTISTTAPLTGGGDLSANRTLGIDLSDISAKYAAPYNFVYRSGFYYEAGIYAPIGGSTYTKDSLIAYPLFINRSVTIDQLSVNVSVIGDATSVVRLGLYNSDSNGLPSTVKVDAGTVSTFTTGTKNITISSTTLAAGLYYFAFVYQIGNLSPTLRSYPNTQGNWSPIGQSSAPAASYNTGYFMNSVTGALPTWSGSSLSSATPARMSFRVA